MRLLGLVFQRKYVAKVYLQSKTDPVKASKYKIIEVVAKSVNVVMGGALVATPLGGITN